MNKYHIAEIDQPAIWESFVQKVAPPTFLQSWNWGEHYRLNRSIIYRIGAYDADHALVGVGLFIVIRAKRGDFLLCPHGPVVLPNCNEADVLKVILSAGKEFARRQRCALMRVAPILPDTPERRRWFKGTGFRRAPIHIHPELSWILDIRPTEDQILKNMRKTTRYMINKAQKSGVEVISRDDIGAIDDFWPIYRETFIRQHFTPFSLDYLKNEFAAFIGDNQALLFFGMVKGEIVTAAMVVFYGQSAFYHQSGSLRPTVDVGASYLLQWRIIQEARRRGCQFYNFWGIAPTDRPHHPWAGLSLFKQGFGGGAQAYVPTQDLPLTPMYWVNYIVETLRRYRRRL